MELKPSIPTWISCFCQCTPNCSVLVSKAVGNVFKRLVISTPLLRAGFISLPMTGNLKRPVSDLWFASLLTLSKETLGSDTELPGRCVIISLVFVISVHWFLSLYWMVERKGWARTPCCELTLSVIRCSLVPFHFSTPTIGSLWKVSSSAQGWKGFQERNALDSLEVATNYRMLTRTVRLSHSSIAKTRTIPGLSSPVLKVHLLMFLKKKSLTKKPWCFHVHTLLSQRWPFQAETQGWRTAGYWGPFPPGVVLTYGGQILKGVCREFTKPTSFDSVFTLSSVTASMIQLAFT